MVQAAVRLRVRTLKIQVEGQLRYWSACSCTFAADGDVGWTRLGLPIQPTSPGLIAEKVRTPRQPWVLSRSTWQKLQEPSAMEKNLHHDEITSSHCSCPSRVSLQKAIRAHISCMIPSHSPAQSPSRQCWTVPVFVINIISFYFSLSLFRQVLESPWPGPFVIRLLILASFSLIALSTLQQSLY